MILDPGTHSNLKSRKRFDSLFRFLCLGAASLGVIILIIFLTKIVIDGLEYFSWKFIVSDLSSRPSRTGIWPAIIGTLYVMVLTAIISVPIGVASAIYLQEFARRKNRFISIIQLNIANLSGVPSIVYGLLGLVLFVKFLALGQSVIAGALTMTLLILPTVMHFIQMI